MKKIFVSTLLFVLFFLGGSYFSNKTNAAAGCPLIITPQNIDANYNKSLTISNQHECFTEKSYMVVIYPPQFNNEKINDIKTAFNKVVPMAGVFRPTSLVVFQSDVVPTDKNNLFVNRVGTDLSNLITFLGKESLGFWNVSVCLQKGEKIPECENPAYFVGQTKISVNPTAPTPTPTPQSDQPIVDTSSSSTCTYAAGTDVKITIKNPEINERYLWWWDERLFKATAMVEFSTSLGQNNYPSWGSAFTFTEDVEPYETLTELTIAGSKISSDLGNGLTELKGHLLCVDKAYYGTSRTGANCLWLYFKPAPPENLGINPTCGKGNSGAVTPTPISPLPPCAEWVQSDGKPIPTTFYNDPTAFTDRECAIVDTGLKIPLETDPALFVKRIFAILLSVVGGIAVLLIIVSGYQLMVSQGNPEKIKEAQERLTSAIVGLLFIIFSLAILQIIGVDILKIPQFGK